MQRKGSRCLWGAVLLLTSGVVSAADFLIHVPVDIRNTGWDRGRIHCWIFSNANHKRSSHPDEIREIGNSRVDFRLDASGSYKGVVSVPVDYLQNEQDATGEGFPPVQDAESYLCRLYLGIAGEPWREASCKEAKATRYPDFYYFARQGTSCRVSIEGLLRGGPLSPPLRRKLRRLQTGKQ